MERLLLYIFAAGILGWTGGCVEQRTRRAGPDIEGIKIGDLSPASSIKLGPQIRFQVLTFEMPVANVPRPKDMFLGLLKSPLHFTDYKAFEANGFCAGFGRSEMWDEIAARLTQAGARNAGTSSLLVFDDKGDDIFFAALGTEQSVFYTTGEGKLVGVNLGAGRLGWQLKARPIPSLRGACEVKLEPVFKRLAGETISRLLGDKQDSEISFDVAGFELTMSSGDFVLLGPIQYEQNDISLGSLFFQTQADFAFPNPEQNEEGGTISDKRTYTLRKDVRLIRLFLVACTGVSD